MPIALFILSFVAGVLWSPYASNIIPLLSDDLVSNFVTLVAAFAGAWAAFSMQSKKEKTLQKGKEIESLLQIQFMLIAQYRKIVGIYDSILKDFHGEPGRWALIGPAKLPSLTYLKIDLLEFRFILRSHPNDLIKIQISIETFHAAIAALDDYSLFCERELIPLREDFDKLDIIALEEQLNSQNKKYIHETLRHKSESIYKLFEGSRDNLEKSIRIMDRVSSEHYPYENFLTLPDDNFDRSRWQI